MSVSCTVTPRDRIAIPIVFVIDTGSPHTFIDSVSAYRARIFTKNLTQHAVTLMGGNKVGLYMLGEARINFRTQNDDLFAVPLKGMKVSEEMRSGKRSITSPVSILGMDFLLESKSSLFADPFAKVAYLDFQQ